MAAHHSVELLAERLGTDSRQASILLDRLAAGMAASLLGGGRVAVDGLGLFSVVHEQAARSTSGNGSTFMPPKERIAFEPRVKIQGDLARIAIDRLGMEAKEAAALAAALSALFAKLRAQASGIELRGFGHLSVVGGAWSFTVDASLDGVLNGLYEGLRGIDMPGLPVAPVRKSDGKPLKAVGVVLGIALLGVAGYVVSTNLPADDRKATAPSVASAPAAVSETPAAVASTPEVAAAPAASSSPDSLVLAKDRCTVIAATFTSLRIAREEARRLSELGHRIMIWTIHDSGRPYYRLVTGDFPGYAEARDSLRHMPAGLTKNAYVQQAKKNVVIYGAERL